MIARLDVGERKSLASTDLFSPFPFSSHPFFLCLFRERKETICNLPSSFLFFLFPPQFSSRAGCENSVGREGGCSFLPFPNADRPTDHSPTFLAARYFQTKIEAKIRTIVYLRCKNYFFLSWNRGPFFWKQIKLIDPRPSLPLFLPSLFSPRPANFTLSRRGKKFFFVAPSHFLNLELFLSLSWAPKRVETSLFPPSSLVMAETHPHRQHKKALLSGPNEMHKKEKTFHSHDKLSRLLFSENCN